MNRLSKEFLDNESGVVAVICAGIMVFLCVFAALSIDYGKVFLMKRELTKAAEAGALSGARGLWPPDFSANPFPSPWNNREPNWSIGYDKGLASATNNLPTIDGVPTDMVTVVTGRWDYSTATKDHDPFTLTQINPNGVRVTIRRNDVPTIFANIVPILLGQAPHPINIEVSATAIMDWTNALPGGSLPIAINLGEANKVGESIKIGLNPSTTDNGGWFTVPPLPTSTPNLLKYIDDHICPPLHLGDPIALNNGTVVPVLDDLYDTLAVIKGSYPTGWDVVIPVVTTDQFNHTDNIVSFVNIRITEVISHGSPKYLKATILALGGTQSGNPGLPPPGSPAATGVLAPPRLVQ
jgi:hypothetical protein